MINRWKNSLRYEECLILTRNTNEDLKNFSFFFFFKFQRIYSSMELLHIFVIVTSNDKSMEKLREKNLYEVQGKV